MAAHFSGFGAPVAHPLVLADRLAQRYEIDRTRSVRLPWFGPRLFFDSRTLILEPDTAPEGSRQTGPGIGTHRGSFGGA